MKSQSYGPWKRKVTKLWSMIKKRDNIMVHELEQRQSYGPLKGQEHEIFKLCFFSWIDRLLSGESHPKIFSKILLFCGGIHENICNLWVTRLQNGPYIALFFWLQLIGKSKDIGTNQPHLLLVYIFS